jgi:hemerythrin superfamily protein
MTTDFQTSSRAAGAAGDAEDALALLSADHSEVAQLFEEYADLADADGSDADRRALVAEICLQLTVHSRLEEEMFYPAVRQALGENELVEEAEAEHRGIEEAMDDLRAMDPADEGYDERVDVLRESVEHHVAEEEGSMFPMVLDSSLDIDRLGEQMAARREELLAQVRDEQSDDYEED